MAKAIEAPEHIADLHAAPYNPRKISDDAMKGLQASLHELGDISGIVWNKRTQHLVSGHQRLNALKREYGGKLKLEDGVVTTPTGGRFAVRVVDWDENFERLANVAANNPLIAGEFTEDLDSLVGNLLESEIGELVKEVRVDELLSSFGGPQEGQTDPDDVPEPAEEPITKPGDLWLLGEHRVLCGDSTKAEDVGRVMGDVEGAVVITDPPYGIAHDVDYQRFTQGGTLCGKAKQRNWGSRIAGDDKPFNPAILLNYSRAVLCGANCYSDKLPCGSWLVWVKKREVNLGQFMSDAEVAWMNHGHGVYVWFHEWDGFNKASERGQSRLHPTQKPVALMVRLIEWANTAGTASVYDPFLGSGTTLIAAEQLNRKCYGIEIEPKYVDVIVRRWEEFTGKKATREAAKP